MWVHQRVRRGDFELRKVAGEVNPADLFTKHLESQAKLDSLLEIFGCELRGGRPSAAPELRREAAADVCHVRSAPVSATTTGGKGGLSSDMTSTYNTSVNMYHNSIPRSSIRHEGESGTRGGRDLSTKLPHQFPLDVLDAHFPKATVVPAPLGEPDVEEEWDGRDHAFTQRAQAMGEKLLSRPTTTTTSGAAGSTSDESRDATIALVRCDEDLTDQTPRDVPQGGWSPPTRSQPKAASLRHRERSGFSTPHTCFPLDDCHHWSGLIPTTHRAVGPDVHRSELPVFEPPYRAVPNTSDDDLHGASSPHDIRSLPTVFELSIQTAPDTNAIDRVHYGAPYEDRSSPRALSIGAGGSFNTQLGAQYEDRSSPRACIIY